MKTLIGNWIFSFILPFERNKVLNEAYIVVHDLKRLLIYVKRFTKPIIEEIRKEKETSFTYMKYFFYFHNKLPIISIDEHKTMKQTLNLDILINVWLFTIGVTKAMRNWQYTFYLFLYSSNILATNLPADDSK